MVELANCGNGEEVEGKWFRGGALCGGDRVGGC